MFYARVELHKPDDTAANYEKLHAQMATAGFLRSILLTSGSRAMLPTGLYCNTTENWTLQYAHTVVTAALATVTLNGEFVVLQCGPALVKGLQTF
jgi:hypothetical protein